MARINITIDDDLEQEFRQEVGKHLGARKGSIQIAIEEAMRLWIKAKRT
jgi:hypothetical protein